MEQTRKFGGKDDVVFWSDKPIQEGHPKYKKPTKWYHIHWYNIPYKPNHLSPCGEFKDTIFSVTLYKCRCGKTKKQL